MLINCIIWGAYLALFIWLTKKGQGHDSLVSGKVAFFVQALAYVATYVSAVALVGFGGLAYAYGLQMMLVAIGNIVLGTWFVYKFLAWDTRVWQKKLGARTPAQLIGFGHNSKFLVKFLALVFAVFLSVYASAVIKGAALMLAQILPFPLEWLIWLVAITVGLCVMIGGFRGVLYTEAMQGAVMLVGILMLIVAVLNKVGLGGFSGLASLEPTAQANNGFLALSSGDAGLYIISLVIVTSVAVWAQPQMMQRHFALASRAQTKKIAPLAMIVVSVLVGGTYLAASLSRMILPEITNLDNVIPSLVAMLLPEIGMQIFVLAIVSASISTTSALFHIAVSAVAEDVPGKPSTKKTWILGIIFCVLLSGGSAQIKGQLIAFLCTASWSIIGAAALVPYIALVRFGQRSSKAALASVLLGFTSTIIWYLLVYAQTALVPNLFGSTLANIPPFFVGIALSLFAWFAVIFVEKRSTSMELDSIALAQND